MDILPELTGDYLFLVVSNSEMARKRLNELVEHPKWKNLKAVRAGQAYVLDEYWGYYDPLTLEMHLDKIAEVMERKAAFCPNQRSFV